MANDMRPDHSTELFELTSYFEGHTTATGVFEDRFGRLKRRFNVTMTGAWRDGVFFLDEVFVYDSGRTETRTWRVVSTGRGRFTATCLDCVGVARGVCDADSIRMTYKFRLTIGRRTLVVDFEDRIYRMDGGIAVNRATMRKWGVRLGELALFFRREGV